MSPPAVTPAPVAPLQYWNNANLKLANGDSDEKHAKAKKKKATVPHNYVSDLQKDLAELGYLKAGSDDGAFGPGTERAVRRFQRHARRKFRMSNSQSVPGTPWSGLVTGICDAATAKEIRAWIDKSYRLPVGVFKLVKIDGGTLRDDVAKAWQAVIDEVKRKGGTLLPPGKKAGDYYSDTWRNPRNGFKHTGGNSKLSNHYTGRAIDLSMEPAGGKGQRWWIAKEASPDRVYWRIYFKTDKQDGSQVEKFAAKTVKYYEFWNNTGEKWIPEGWYIDLTDVLASNGFERIPAQSGWESVAKKREWWHFHYSKDVQETFLDEMELVGFREADLEKAGWTIADMDKAPG